MILASEFIERAAGSDFGKAVNDEYALRWAMLRAESDPVRALDVAELGPDDLEVLSPEGWLWLGAQLGSSDPELPSALVEALFTATEDPVLRLLVADTSLRHPAFAARMLSGGPTLADLPPSWARDRLTRLSRATGDRDGLVEMTTILLQIANKPALRLLGALRRGVPQLVEETVGTITGRQGPALDDLLGQLGISGYD